MKYKGKLLKIGGSMYVIVPAIVRKSKKLKENDIIEVDIKKVVKKKTYRRKK